MSSVGNIVRKTQPLVFWCMRGLTKSKREAMYTIFAFCRHLDAVARSDMAFIEKTELLQAWHEEIDNIYDKKVPATAIGRKIYKNCMRFDLPKAMLREILESVEFNVIDPLKAPEDALFERYVNGVAVIPLELALRIVDSSHIQANHELAESLGKAVFITSVLRDIKDEAKQGFFYMPRSILQYAGIEISTPRSMVEHNNLAVAREKLSQQAEIGYAKAKRLLGKMNRKDTRAFRLIEALAYAQFAIMKKRGWEIVSPKPRLGWWQQIKILSEVLL